MSPKEQYKLGSQVGRQQNTLRKNNLGHTDLHSGNIVKPNPNKRKSYLIDNEAFQPVHDIYDENLLKPHELQTGLGKPFMTGYNSRINFTQHTQMQHFANFGIPIPQGVKNLGGKANAAIMNNLDVAFPASAGGVIGSTIGSTIGLVKGAGVGETEEERANTTAGGRVGKIFGKTLAGGAIGAATGGAVGAGAGYGARYLRNRKGVEAGISENSYGAGSVSNFGFEQIANTAKNWGQKAVAGNRTFADTVGGLSQLRGTQIGAGVGAAAGLARGAGIGESEEEKARTTGWGRVRKLSGNVAGGTLAGGVAGSLGSVISPLVKNTYTQNLENVQRGIPH